LQKFNSKIIYKGLLGKALKNVNRDAPSQNY
jgi:hypothetical protein